MTPWPFGSFLPEESWIRKNLGSSNSNIIILFCIDKYYVAVSNSADLLNSIGYKIRTSKVKKKQIDYCVLAASIPLENLLSKLPKSIIVITKVL